MPDSDFAIEKIDFTLPVGRQVTCALRNAIIRNRFAPGQRISESEIGTMFGVSRQPVREAFIKLADEGLLEVRPQRGTFLRRISLDAVLDARFVREAVEADIVKLCATNAAPGLIDRLYRLVDSQAKLADVSPEAFIPLDDEFHRELAKGAGRPNAWMVIDGMKSQMDRVRQLSTQNLPIDHLVAQHRAVVDAIARQDPKAAEAAMRDHLHMILKDIPWIREKFPDHFEPAAS